MSSGRFRVVDESALGGKRTDDEFTKLKKSLIQAGQLWVDPDFPTTTESIGAIDEILDEDNKPVPISTLKWQRPTSIAAPDQPFFTIDGVSRYDIQQGNVGDCWFIASMACLTADKELFDRCIPSNQTFNKGDYAGIFRFFFWRYGQWVEVWVDDQLTVFGDNPKSLVFANCFTKNEFWVPLLEKAYAKLYCNYGGLNGGFATDALVDFTGGVGEMINLVALRDDPSSPITEAVYNKYGRLLGKQAFVAASITGTGTQENGLVTGHVYSITGMAEVPSKNKGEPSSMLIRLRNPWGQFEYKGPWSDDSPEMRALTDAEKEQYGLKTNVDDGEFWMTFHDFVQNYTWSLICLMGTNSIACAKEIVSKGGKRRWMEKAYHDKWEAGHNAGGINYETDPNFWKNPQVLLTIGDGGKGSNQSDSDKTHIIVSLMEKMDNLQQRDDRRIAAIVFKAPPEGQLLDAKTSQAVNNDDQGFDPTREVTNEFALDPGRYVIVPCTLEGNRNGQFLLRTYTETDAQLEELDKKTVIKTPDAVLKDNNIPKFNNMAAEPGTMDAKELAKALNQLLPKERFPILSVETARNLVAMFDDDKNGVISAGEYQKLLTQLRLWKESFNKCDVNHSGDIDTYELEKLFALCGFDLSRRVQRSIYQRYSGRANRLDLEDFVHAASRLVVLTKSFQNLSKASGVKKDSAAGDTIQQLSMDDWLSATVYA